MSRNEPRTAQPARDGTGREPQAAEGSRIMERDDLLLRAIAEGATSSAALAERTGLSPASVWRGLRRLMASEYVFSPTRGIYRLTASGERVLAPHGGDPAAAVGRIPSDAGLEPPVTVSTPQRDLRASSRQAGAATLPTWLVGSALVALGVGVVALLAIVARPSAPVPPSVTPASPAAWPYDGQTWGM